VNVYSSKFYGTTAQKLYHKNQNIIVTINTTTTIIIIHVYPSNSGQQMILWRRIHGIRKREKMTNDSRNINLSPGQCRCQLIYFQCKNFFKFNLESSPGESATNLQAILLMMFAINFSFFITCSDLH
jgi:hypothetical protein